MAGQVGFGLQFFGDSRAAKKALKDVSGEMRGVGRAAKLMQSPTVAAAAAVAAVATAAASMVRIGGDVGRTLGDWAAETALANDELIKTSRNLGVNADFLQSFQFAGERAGVAAASISKGLKQLAVQSANAARGSVQQIEVFERLGVEFTTVGGAMRSTEGIVRDLADAIQAQGINSRTTADLSILLGRSGAEMGNLMLGGASGVDEMTARLEELGALQSGEALAAAERYQDALLDLEVASTGLRREVANFLIPTLTKLAEGITAVAVGGAGQAGAEIAAAVLDGLAQSMGGTGAAAALAARALFGYVEANNEAAAAANAATAQQKALGDAIVGLGRPTEMMVQAQRDLSAAQRDSEKAARAAAAADRDAARAAAKSASDAAAAARDRTARDQEATDTRRRLLRIGISEQAMASARELDTLREIDAARAANNISEVDRQQILLQITLDRIATVEAAELAAAEKQKIDADRAAAEAQDRAAMVADFAMGQAAASTSAIAGLSGTLADIVADNYGRQSKEARDAARAAFITSQAAALAIATVDMFRAIGAANALGPPQNIPFMIAAGVIGGIQIAGIAATTIAGVADAGATPDMIRAMQNAGVTQVFNLDKARRPEALITDPVGTSLLTNDLAGTFRTVRQEQARSEARDRNVARLADQIRQGGGPRRDQPTRIESRTTAVVDGRVLYDVQSARMIDAADRGISPGR